MSKRDCPECGGTGECLDDVVEAAGFPTRITYRCGFCNGKGWLTAKQGEWYDANHKEKVGMTRLAIAGGWRENDKPVAAEPTNCEGEGT